MCDAVPARAANASVERSTAAISAASCCRQPAMRRREARDGASANATLRLSTVALRA